MTHTPIFTSADLAFHHTLTEEPARELFPMHAHTSYELYHFIRGNAFYMVEGNRYALTPGCVLLMRPSETHCLVINENEPYERIAIHFTHGALLTAVPTGALFAPFDDRPLGQYNLYTEGDIGSSFITDCLTGIGFADNPNPRLSITCALLAALERIGTTFRQGAHFQPNTTENRRAAEIVEYINGNLFEQLSLTRLCDRFYISKAQLNRIFRGATGSSVWEYISLKRLFAARELLRLGHSAAETALLVGFADYSAFYRAYKAQFHTSPKSDLSDD